MPLRADAEQKRCKLLVAAQDVFAEQGLNAPLDVIARRAGVGNATLYRRFPTRADLVSVVFADAVAEVVAATDRALAHPDAWTGFAEHVTHLFSLQAENRALADLLTTSTPGAEIEDARLRARSGLARLVDRAKAEGGLRADFAAEDLVLLLMANAGLLERTRGTEPPAWRRHLSYVLDGLRASAATPPAAPPGPGQVRHAMRDLAARHGCA